MLFYLEKIMKISTKNNNKSKKQSQAKKKLNQKEVNKNGKANS